MDGGKSFLHAMLCTELLNKDNFETTHIFTFHFSAKSIDYQIRLLLDWIFPWCPWWASSRRPRSNLKTGRCRHVIYSRVRISWSLVQDSSTGDLEILDGGYNAFKNLVEKEEVCSGTPMMIIRTPAHAFAKDQEKGQKLCSNAFGEGCCCCCCRYHCMYAYISGSWALVNLSGKLLDWHLAKELDRHEQEPRHYANIHSLLVIQQKNDDGKSQYEAVENAGGQQDHLVGLTNRSGFVLLVQVSRLFLPITHIQA